MSMTNVKIRCDALDKFMLPVDIKYGIIKKLVIKVPIINIGDRPVSIELQGADLILAPKTQEDWKFMDIFSEEYMKEKLQAMAQSIISDIQSQHVQGWADKLKIKILDNFTMNIKDVHIRFEDISEIGSSTRNQIGQTTFGVLLSELDLKTVDADGNAMFHDRAVKGGQITKVLKMEGLAIYLNPQDTLIIHQIAAENPDPEVQISSMQALMDKVVTPYRLQVQIERENQDVPIHSQQKMIETAEEEEFITYILRPMNLELMYEHEVETNKSMKVSIKLDSLQLSLQHQQLKAILKMIKHVQNYKKMAFMQDKLRKFRQFRPMEQIEFAEDDMAMEFGSGGLRPGFNGKAWWKFAITSIIKSFQFKRGSINAFKMNMELEQTSNAIFKQHMEAMYGKDMDDKKREVYLEEMNPTESKEFWHVISMIQPDQLRDWTQKVITPIEEAKFKKTVAEPNGVKTSRMESVKNLFRWKKADNSVQENPQQDQSAAAAAVNMAEDQDSEDSFGEEEFFDCLDTEEPEQMQDEQQEEEKKEERQENEQIYVEKSLTRERTSLTFCLDVRELSLTLGKLSQSNKIEGIQFFSKNVSIVTTSPSLNIDKQFVTEAKIQEWGVSLITLNRRTNMEIDSVPVVQTNKNYRRVVNPSSVLPQLKLIIIKNDTSLAQHNIELDLSLMVGSIVFKYNEDLIIRSKAIARLKVDSSLQAEALDQLEELRENTQSAIHALIYKRRNRYNISIGSPVILLPINGTYQGKFSPIWAVRTGALNISSADPKDSNEDESGIFENLSLDRRNSTPKSKFNFAKAVRRLMRGSSMPKSRGVDTDQYFDHFRVTISQMGMTYYQSYQIYEQQARGGGQLSRQRSVSPVRLGRMSSQAYDSENPNLQNMQKFDVLDEFEIKIQAKLRKKQDKVVLDSEQERNLFKSMPKVVLRVDTSSINIRLSHSIYNNLFNLKYIFTISKEKAKEYNKEMTQFNVQVKQQLIQEAKIQGFLEQKVFTDTRASQFEKVYCVLSGNHLYFYKDQDSLLYIDHFYLKQTEITEQFGVSQDRTRTYEVVIHKGNTNDPLPVKSSTFGKAKRPEIFTQETFESGSARKIKFSSQAEMNLWLDAIREVTVGMILDWNENTGTSLSGRLVSNIQEQLAEQPQPNYFRSDVMKEKKAVLNGARGNSRLLELKTFQQNQMHGNFNEMVTSIMTTYEDESNQSRSNISNVDQEEIEEVSLEIDASIPSFEVELMKLRLVPGGQEVAKPASFEKWVTYAMIGMSFWREQRKYDEYIKATINKISLIDESMIINERLMTQITNSGGRRSTHTKNQQKLLGVIKDKLGSNQDFEEPALLVEKKVIKKLSPRFDGIYNQTNVTMANIQINFMPGTYNNIIKLLRATKPQTKPVDDEFLAGQEYDENAMSAKDTDEELSENHMEESKLVEKSDDSSSSSDIEKNPILRDFVANNDSMAEKSTIQTGRHQNRRYAIDAEQEMVIKATDLNEYRNYDLDCKEEKDKPMLVIVQFKRISIGMLHPKYQMEMFRLQTKCMDVRYEVFYDHAEMSVKFARTTLLDLTGYPYSVNPKKFFKFVRQNPSVNQSPQGKIMRSPREMIYFNGMDMKIHMIQSKNCPHKEAGFSSKMEIKIDTMRLNYIQEVNLRFNDYFMEQFMDCFFMSDPYKDPKKSFDEIRSRSQIFVSQITQDTDFQFPEEIGKMDVKIKNFEMKVKDRPHSKDYIIFEIPIITCDKTKGTIDGLIPRKPKLTFQSESIWTRIPEIQFWFGRESGQHDLTVKDSKLKLLRNPFSCTVEFKRLSGSEVIAKISQFEMDKAARVNLKFSPIELIWPQSIYTYMLRCGDLNFAYTDGMQEEYYFIKWIEMSEHYMSDKKVISKKFDIQIPALSMTLQNSDGSFIAEMIWKQFHQLQTNYTDTDKEINISCQQFYILDKINSKKPAAKLKKQEMAARRKLSSKGKKNRGDENEIKHLKQAVVCPMNSSMYVNSRDIIHEEIKFSEDEPKNMKIFTRMAPGGDKTNTVDIDSIKFFLKPQTFIFMQAFFMNAFPKYKIDSVDKPNGYNEDPERQNTMVMQFNIFNSLICFLNKPGKESICCQGNITIDMVQESISRCKEKYRQEIENLLYRPSRSSSANLFPEMAADFEPPVTEDGANQSRSNSTNDSSDKQEQQEEAVAQINRIYFQKITVKNFTPFICRLEQLDDSSFAGVKKRQMMNPVDILFENKFNLRHEEQEQSNRNESMHQDQERAMSEHHNARGPQRNQSYPKRGISVDDLCDDDDSGSQDEGINNNLLIPNSAPLAKTLIQSHDVPREFQSQADLSMQRRNQLNWIWGVTSESYAHIGITKLRISIQDVHLLFQIVTFASDQITSESVNKLKEIHEDIEERENVRGKSHRKPKVTALQITEEHKQSSGSQKVHNFRAQSEVMGLANRPYIVQTQEKDDSQFIGIPEVTHSEEALSESALPDGQRMDDKDQTGQEIFDGLIEKLENKFEPTMSSQMERLRTSTTAFQKIANGYTQKKYLERGSFQEFLKKDILTTDEDKSNDSDFLSANEANVQEEDDITGEENRRRTLLRINNRNMKNGLRADDTDALAIIHQDSNPESEASPRNEHHVQNNRNSNGSKEPGFQSDVRDESSVDQVNVGMFGGDAGGPSSKKKSSYASSYARNLTHGSGSMSQKDKRSSEDEQRLRNNKDSMQDVLSEFFYSCGGKSIADRDRGSKHQLRRSIEESKDTGQENQNQFSDRGSDEDAEQLPHGEFNNDMDHLDSKAQRTFSSFFNRGNYGVKKIQSKSFGVSIRPNSGQIKAPSINSSIIGDNSKTFFQNNANIAPETRTNDRGSYKHCMDNVMRTQSEMFCSQLSFLFINDFNQAFTPVIELQMIGLDNSQSYDKEADLNEQNVSLTQMTATYFNLELGEWEPLVENLAFNTMTNNTPSQETLIVNFDGPVNINITQACLRNISYTLEAWNEMPQFAKTGTKMQAIEADVPNPIIDSQISKNTMKMHLTSKDSHSSYSINSSSSPEEENFQMTVTSQRLMQVQENIRQSNIPPTIEEESKQSNDSLVADQYKDINVNGAVLSDDENENEDNQQLEQITPFQIKNQTNNKIVVVQGGIIDVSPYYASADSTSFNHSNQRGFTEGTSMYGKRTSETSALQFQQHFGGKKIFPIETGRQCNYSVTYAQLVNEQQKNQQRMQKRREAEILEQAQAQQLDQNLMRTSDGFDIMPDNDLLEEAMQKAQQETGVEDSQDSDNNGAPENITTFKNAVIIGVRINDIDAIQNIDLNEISHQDPYVFNTSSSYSVNESQDGFQDLANRPSNPMNADMTYNIQGQNEEKQQKMKASQLLEKQSNDSLGLYYNYIFYGVVLDKMQKQLVIRTPYVFNNKTLLTIEVQIKKQPANFGQNGQVDSQSDLESPLTSNMNLRQSFEKVRFLLKPGDKFPLDQMYYYNDSCIAVRVVDQNSIQAYESNDKKVGTVQTTQSSAKMEGSGANPNSEMSKNRGRFLGRKYSREVPIVKLLNLEKNQGPGEFISGPESDSLCMSIKRQPGELYGTTDLVFLPTLSVKNCLPCNMKIKRRKRLEYADELVLRQSQQEEKTEYNIMKSEQKDFYTFDGCGEQGNEISLQIHVDGFLLSDEIRLNQREVKNCDVEIQDRFDNRLTLGMRVQPFRAGYQVTFYAHACIQLETIRLLSRDSIRVLYPAESIKQTVVKTIARVKNRNMLAGQEELVKNRFVMCNNDQAIRISIKEQKIVKRGLEDRANSKQGLTNSDRLKNDYFAPKKEANDLESINSSQMNVDQSEFEVIKPRKGKHIFFSNDLDIRQAGKLTDFSIKTEQADLMSKLRTPKLSTHLMKYDFSMNTSLVMADFEDFIFTKMIVVSPKYVLVNHMNSQLEVAQINTEETQMGRQVMEVGDRKEWVWSDYNKENLICIRKAGYIEEYSDYSEDSESEEALDKSNGIESEDEDSKPIIRQHRRADSFDEQDQSGPINIMTTDGLDDTRENMVDTSKDDSRYVSGKLGYKNKMASSSKKDSKLLLSKRDESPGRPLSSGKKKRKPRQSSRQGPNITRGESTNYRTSSRRFKRASSASKSGLTEADKVSIWEWSKGFDPAQNEQMTLSVMIREAENFNELTQDSMMLELKQHQVKVIRVHKKLLNNTIFVIFEDESPLFPLYRIINDCVNVKVKMQQFEMDEPKTPEVIDSRQNMIFGFYEPENKRQIELTLIIDKNDRTQKHSYRQGNEQIENKIIDLTQTMSLKKDLIHYQDAAGREHSLELSLKNDGQTKTIRLTPRIDEESVLDDDRIAAHLQNSGIEHEMLAKQEDELERRKIKNTQPNKVIKVTLNDLLVSFVVKVQVSKQQGVQIDENRELALLSLKDIKFTYDFKSKDKKHIVNFQVGHFQIDNQSEQNPLFQQIFMSKRHRGLTSRDEDRTGEARVNNPFVKIDFDYRVTHESQVTIVEKFHCTFNEMIASIDSDYLINFGWAMSKIRPLFENKMARVHPLFMKESICEIRNNEVELVNKDEHYDAIFEQQITVPGKEKPIGSQLLLSRQSNDLEDSQRNFMNSSSGSGIDFLALQEARANEYQSQVRVKEVIKQKELLTNVMGEILIEDKLCHYTLDSAPNALRLWHQQDVKNSKETLYLKEFLIDQINIDLSFVVKTADGMSSQAEMSEQVGPLAYLKMSGLSLINIDEARFRLARFGVQNLFIGKEDMQKYCSNFYGQRLMTELRKLVGSVGILASPRTLFYSIGDGFHDFMAMPADGYAESGVIGGTYGMAAGTISLTKQIGLGSLQSTQQFFRDSSQLVLLATKDKDYMRNREDRMIIEKPQNFVDGFGYGANSLVQGLKGGLFGVFTRPVIEARRRGLRGFGSGLYQSLAGLIFKPLSGGLDLVSKSAEGFKNTIRRFDVNSAKDRVRQPRVFYGQAQRIKQFDWHDSLLVAEVLTQVGDCRFKNNHYLEMKLIRPTNQNAHFLMLTEEQLFLIEANQKELVWYIKTELIQQVRPTQYGLIIFLVEEFEGQSEFPLFIDQVSSREIAQWLNAIAYEFN